MLLFYKPAVANSQRAGIGASVASGLGGARNGCTAQDRHCVQPSAPLARTKPGERSKPDISIAFLIRWHQWPCRELWSQMTTICILGAIKGIGYGLPRLPPDEQLRIVGLGGFLHACWQWARRGNELFNPWSSWAGLSTVVTWWEPWGTWSSNLHRSKTVSFGLGKELGSV